MRTIPNAIPRRVRFRVRVHANNWQCSPDLLSIRMTQTNLERHLDRVHEILRAAAKHLGYTGATKAVTFSELSQALKAFDEELRKTESLFLRVT